MPQIMMASGGDDDRISSLPDGVLHRILGFLRWRHLWKCTPVLRLTRPWAPAHSLQELMNQYHLLGRSNSSRLEMFFLDCVTHLLHDVLFINLWILYALSRQILLLDLSVARTALARGHFRLDPLSTKQSTILELNGPTLSDKFLDFLRCPGLLDIKFVNCRITADRISSLSLEFLEIVECDFNEDRRTRISAPSLISLELTLNFGRTPLLEDMPLLESAEIYINCETMEVCSNDDAGYCNDSACINCYVTNDGSTGCVLLNGLAAATTLDLMAYPEEVSVSYVQVSSQLKSEKICASDGYIGLVHLDMHVA